LSAALAARDWAAFARGYKGPLYARSDYDGRIAAAYANYGGKATAKAASDRKPEPVGGELLCRGMRAAAVYDLQAMLTSLGYGARPDGIFGPNTERAVKAFQRARHLAADGIVGPATRAGLEAAMRATPSFLAFLRRMWISLLGRLGLT
jgi:hypothetical protein